MTNREIFTKAHQIARNTVATVGDYAYALKLALQDLYAEIKAPKNDTKATSLDQFIQSTEDTTEETAQTHEEPAQHFDTGVQLSQFLLKYFKAEGYNTRKIGIMSTAKRAIRVRIKDASINFDYVNDIVKRYTPSNLTSVVIYA